MNNLTIYHKDDYGIIYSYLNFFISVPNDINDNIKLRLSFEKNQSELVNRMNSYRTKDKNILFLSISNDINNTNFIDELTKLKRLINEVYNQILKEKKLTRKNFIRKIELIDNGNNKEFIKWLCEYYPNKFYKGDIIHQDLFTNKDIIFNSPITDTVNNVPVVNSSYTPTEEKISIGELDSIYKENVHNNYKEYNKSLNNSAFIKLPMIMLMLLMISVTALIITLVLLK